MWTAIEHKCYEMYFKHVPIKLDSQRMHNNRWMSKESLKVIKQRVADGRDTQSSTVTVTTQSIKDQEQGSGSGLIKKDSTTCLQEMVDRVFSEKNPKDLMPTSETNSQ